MNKITMTLNVDNLIKMALQEDISSEDVTTNAVMREEKTGKAFTEVEKLKFYYSSDKHTCKVESVSKKEAEKIWQLMCDHSDDNTISHVCEVSNLKAKMEKGEFPPCAVLMFSKSGQLIKGHTYVEALARSVKVSKLNFVVQRGCEEDWGVY